MFKYNCLNPIAAIGLDNFDSNYEKTDDVNDAEGILVRSAAMHDMEFSDKLLCVARAGAGVNNIPLDRCAEKGIVVFNTPGANANGVKELVFAGMLLASRDITGGIQWVKDNASDPEVGKAAEKAKKAYAGTELQGKKLGIIGLGAIGIKVANTATNLGMEVLGYDPYLSVDAAWNLSRAVKHVVNVDDIYAECDYITIHVPLLDATKGMINKEAVEKMKDGVIILNFARDLLCDEAAVIEGIKAGKVRKYVSDFPNATTAGQDGCIVIPHLGASTEESEDNCAVMAVMQLMDFMENGNIKNSVNFPPVDMGRADGVTRVCVTHKSDVKAQDIAAMLTGAGFNLKGMASKEKGGYAYSMLDIDGNADGAQAAVAGDGILKVRVIG